MHRNNQPMIANRGTTSEPNIWFEGWYTPQMKRIKSTIKVSCSGLSSLSNGFPLAVGGGGSDDGK